MKLLTATLVAAFFAATAGAALAGGDGGCAFDTKRQLSADTLLPAPDQAPSTGS